MLDCGLIKYCLKLINKHLWSQNTFFFLKSKNNVFLHKAMTNHIWIYISNFMIFFPKITKIENFKLMIFLFKIFELSLSFTEKKTL